MRNELADTSFGALWIHLHLRRLPRGFSNVVVGVVYHPPRSDNAAMLDYLSNCLSYIESHFPNSGLILLGDFNKLNITRLCSSYNLKQIVKFATRGSDTLDLILTNLSSFYTSPIRISPFGLSDHLSIEVKAKDRSPLPAVSKVKVKTRDLRPSARFAIRRYLELVHVRVLSIKCHYVKEKFLFSNPLLRSAWILFAHFVIKQYIQFKQSPLVNCKIK